ncbi:MAG: hypothetical protein R3E77_13900 [Steroidobacteraceae bacterium]
MKRILRLEHALAGIGLLLSASANAAPAKYDCYRFDKLAEDSRYTVGDVIDTEHAVITIKQYYTNGNPAMADARRAEVVNSKIAGGDSPELSVYLVSVNVVPKQPITRVRTRLAQSISQSGGFANANIVVNGEKHESPNGFAAMDGKIIGRPGKGRAKITAHIAPTGSGNWHSGTFELASKPGETIESFTIGGHTWRIDDMCIGL